MNSWYSDRNGALMSVRGIQRVEQPRPKKYSEQAVSRFGIEAASYGLDIGTVALKNGGLNVESGKVGNSNR